MSKPILILGTRTLAEELADVISEIPGCEVVGFVENMERERCESQLRGLPVFWVEEIGPLASTHLAVCGLATTHRKRYAEQVAAIGFRFATLIHPSARVSSKAVLGEGCLISPMCSVSAYTTLGQHVFVNRGALIGHHTTIGDYVTIHPGANVAGMVTVGDGTYIGMGAVVIDKMNIGSGSIVGAGAVVTKDVPDRVQVVGVPAKVVKTEIEGK